MSKQTQGTMLMVGALAGTVGLVAFVALMILGEYAFSPALFLAIIIAGAAAVALTVGFHRKPSEPPLQRQAHAPTPKPSDVSAVAPQPAPGSTPPATGNVTAPASAAAAPSVSAETGSPSVASAAPSAEGGTKPATLAAPRNGQADDLKMIKGVGPKLEQMVNDMGFYHFDQVANWTADEVAWVDENLEGFKGRVSRDEWVSQAKTLAAGGETEFSKKVESGTVY